MNPNDIAIVGIAAHLPAAPDVAGFWRNLLDGFESVRELDESELLEAGVPASLLRRPDYVRAASTLEGVFDFDADFFGLSPKEAGIMDPQHRHFLMAAWEAMEDAGHVPESFDGAIGVFAGVGQGSYFTGNLMTNPDLVREVGPFLLRHTGNDKDFLTTRASYIFNLRGPSVNVQTACSTSLVATHLAVQHLLSGECDMALAGGSTIEIPHGQGYVYHEGEVLSPDGHCRAFDHRSRGTVFGSGSGVVVLRRVADAVDDGDHIYAVIRGSAVNNDGAQKVGYLAPSVDGQAACITEALAVADVDPGTIGFVECHGTGTPMGDPIEVAALTQAFAVTEQPEPDCRLGSVKTNIGHLDTAAGVAGLIKATLALHEGVIPPTINFEKPNPELDLESTPFSVNDETVPWPSLGEEPRRAAVNSLGVGGTNAFVVLEQAPDIARDRSTESPERWRLLTLSARSRTALDDATQRLADHLRQHPELDLADVEWTLQHGRHHFEHRRVLAARTLPEAIELLEERSPRRLFDHVASTRRSGLTFMFPGGGAQHPRMAAGLYRAEPIFAQHVDEGLRLLADTHGLDLREQLLGDLDAIDRAALDTTTQQLPLIFIVEYALAQLLMSWGIEPTAMIGHSLGEKTAACIAGTISFEDCLGLIVCRAEVVTRASGGALTVPLGPEELFEIVDELGLDIAVVNAPDTCVVSGANDVLDTLAERLREDGVEVIKVPMNVPPHSRLLEPGLDDYRSYLESISLHAPSIPWVSGRTGTWITDEQATDPSYWVDHLRHTIVFSDAVATLAEDPERILVEVGPGRTLSSLVRAHPAVKSSHVAIPLMRHADDPIDDEAALLSAVGRIWAAGGEVDTDRLFEGESPRRVPLPTYAFQKQTYYIAPGTGASPEEDSGVVVERIEDEDRWSWKPVWRSIDREEPSQEPTTWMVLVDRTGFGDRVVERLRRRGDTVVVVRTGDAYRVVSDDEYVISPELGAMDYDLLMHDLVRNDRVPDRVVHLALLATDDRDFRPGSSFFHRNQELGLQSLVHIARAWESSGVVPPLRLSVATVGSRSVGSEPAPWPEQSTVLGPVSVLPREFAGSTASTFDLDRDELSVAVGHDRRGRRRPQLPWAPPPEEVDPDRLLEEVVGELTAPPHDEVVALRGDRRYVHDVRHAALPDGVSVPLRQGAAVLVTGGLGGIGLTIAQELHRLAGARLALLSRSALPDRSQWDELEQRLGAHHPTVERIAGVRRLEESGAEVLLLSGDVSDPESVGQALDQVRSRFGGVHAVVHAAGVVDDALIVSKSPTEMDDVLAPKVYGTLVLDDATRDDELDLFVVFSSTSTLTAPIGQTDYVAANAFLNAFTEAKAAHGDTRYRAIDWGVWNEVGMAAAAVEHWDAADDPQTWQAEHPWFDQVIRSVDGLARVRCRWDADVDWVFDDHRIASGAALLPGAAYPELARAALAELGVTRPFELRDLTFLRPLAAPGSGLVEAEVVLTPDEQGYRFELRERVTLEEPGSEGSPAGERKGRRTTGSANILLHDLDAVGQLDLDQDVLAYPTRDPNSSHQQDHLRFGPRWQVLRRVQRGPSGSLAWLSLDEHLVGDVDQVGLHPALFDLGTGFAMDLIDGYTGDHLWVPLDYRQIRIFDRLPSAIVARASVLASSSEASGFATFDIDLCDLDGRVLVRVDGFTVKRLDGALEVGTDRRVLASEVELDAPSGAARQLSLPETALRDNLTRGIGPEEGQRLFRRALGVCDLPVVYLSTMDLHELRSQSDAIAAAQTRSASAGSSAVFSRPQLSSDFVAPRNDIEEQLVAMWQELLGIDEVGVQDDFFDLGGHSLIAVRLFAQIKRTFAVEFPISVLVEAPTIEACAGLIAGALPDDARSSDGDAPVAVATQPRFRYLVPMHPSDGTDTTPFFLVAGMFGNVLNLRHLAHQIGADRPFYGVQARGLFGGDEPHESFEAMARDYLAEVRDVQPHGPYLLGGFSGGGYTALEMARMLRAEGEEIALLVMLDTPIPDNPPLTLQDRIKIQLDGLREDGPAYVRRWARERMAWERARRRGFDAPVEENVLHSTVIEGAFHRALERYQLEYYPGVITLFRPKLAPAHVLGPDRQINVHRRFLYHDNGWGPYCDRVDVTEVPGDHDSMVLEPAVRVLTNHIRTKITKADDRSPAITAR